MRKILILTFLITSEIGAFAQWESFNLMPSQLNASGFSFYVREDSAVSAVRSTIGGVSQGIGVSILAEDGVRDITPDPVPQSFGSPPWIGGTDNSDIYLIYDFNSFMSFDGSSWTDLGTTGLPFQLNSQDFIVLSDNEMYLTAIGPGSIDKRPQVLKYDGDSWSSVGSQYAHPTLDGFEVNIAMKPDGYPAIAFTSLNSGDLQMAVLEFDGTDWNPVGSVGFATGTSADYMDLAINGQGDYFVALIDNNDNDKPKVYTYENGGTAWTQMTLPTNVVGSCEEVAIRTRDDGHPVMLALSNINSGSYSYNGSDWDDLGDFGSSDYSELDFEIYNGELYAARQSGKARVSKYSNGFTGFEEVQNSYMLYPNPVNDQLRISGAGLTEVRVFDISGKALRSRSLSGAAQVELDLTDLTPGFYTVQLTDRNGKVATHKVVKQ